MLDVVVRECIRRRNTLIEEALIELDNEFTIGFFGSKVAGGSLRKNRAGS